MTRPVRTYHIIRQIMSPAGWAAVTAPSVSINDICDPDARCRYALLEKTQRRSTTPKLRLISTHKIIITGSDLAHIQRVKAKLEAKAQP